MSSWFDLTVGWIVGECECACLSTRACLYVSDCVCVCMWAIACVWVCMCKLVDRLFSIGKDTSCQSRDLWSSILEDAHLMTPLSAGCAALILGCFGLGLLVSALIYCSISGAKKVWCHVSLVGVWLSWWCGGHVCVSLSGGVWLCLRVESLCGGGYIPVYPWL